MKKKTNYISPFVMVLIVGLVISFINGDFKIGSYFEGLKVIDLEVLLDYLNLGLGFLAFGSVFVYLIVRAGRKEKDPGQLTKKDGGRPFDTLPPSVSYSGQETDDGLD